MESITPGGSEKIPDSSPKQADFMEVRRRISGHTDDPIELENIIQILHREENLPVRVLRDCARELIQEKKRREKNKEMEDRLRNIAGTGNVVPIRLGRTHEKIGNWTEKLLINRDGDIKDCPANIITILQEHEYWSGRIKFNVVSNRIEIDGRSLLDVDLAGIMQWLALDMKMSVRSAAHVLLAARKVAEDHAYNPITEWLEGLPEWDGTLRLDTLFSDVFGTQQSPYSAHCAKTIFCSLIARAYRPGCVVRSVVILEGNEKIGKSQFVRDIGDPWSREILTSLENVVASAEIIQGLWVAELPELDSLVRTRESRVKAFITICIDRYREPYARVSEDRPRLTVFIGTVNPPDGRNQFREEEENTRWFPIPVIYYEREVFLSMREQLFAEALAYYRRHENDWWEAGEEVSNEAKKLREERTSQDPWTYEISNYLIGHAEVTISGIMDALEIPMDRRTKTMSQRIGTIIRGLGWDVKRSDYTSGRRVRMYTRCIEIGG